MKKSQQQPKLKQKIVSARNPTLSNALVLAINMEMLYNMNKMSKGIAAAAVGCGGLSRITAE